MSSKEKDMTKKLYDLPDKTIEIIHDVMKETGLKHEVDALKLIIHDYKNMKDWKYLIDDKMPKKIKEELSNDLTRLRLGVRTAERNSIVMKDILNTMLYVENYHYLMPAVGKEKHKMLIEAEKHLEEIISHAKQVKDNEKLRKGLE